MRILVTTCDQYLHLLEPYATLFNRYWPNQDVTFLGFDDSDIPELPDNFDYVSLGKQSDFGRYWTDPILPYIDKIKEDYFVIICGDIFITDYVDLQKIQLLEKEISSGNADKAMLDTHLNVYSAEYKAGMMQMLPSAPYRTSLHPAIWRKEYFKKYLKPNFTIWDFEIKNMPESQKDGATIISCLSPPNLPDVDPATMVALAAPANLVKTVNVYEKGVPIPRWGSVSPWGASAGITKEDILLIYDYIDGTKRPVLEKILEDGKRYN
jgi:hypothetical protein